MSQLICFKCGRECDPFTDVFEVDDDDDHGHCLCRFCDKSDRRLIEIMQLTIRLHLERAYALIAKKRKRVAA
jgi:hypothetical protein